jgi:glycosyltransferase involved in cell wall biosynthesis
VDHQELPGLVAAAGVFAFPSVREGFGLAAMEALAAGVPVVTRDLPVFREVFGTSVRFAGATELAGQLLAALEEPRGRSAPAGRALAARHSWDDAAAAHLRLYEQLITVGRPVGHR